LQLRVFALFLVAALAGCVTISSSQIGTFAGVLPCADCAGILSELHLYAEQPSGRPTHYELMETYMGTRDGDRSIGTAGRWATSRGSASDAGATVVQIDLGRIDAVMNFLRIGDDELRLLDRKRQEIFSKTPHSLHRVSELPPVTLVEADSGRTIEVDPGQRVFVVLGANRTTGYDWALEMLLATSPGVLTSLGEPAYALGATTLGGGGTTLWFFAAKAKGKQELRLNYRRPSQPESPAAKTVSYTVSVR
jgi:copper homeostasis protein (lipoprotein)